MLWDVAGWDIPTIPATSETRRLSSGLEARTYMIFILFKSPKALNTEAILLPMASQWNCLGFIISV